jgi:dTDP-glucose pyrophosphorylase
MMNLVLTMAGKYERFKLFGNKIPKYLMPLGSRTVLWHVIKKLADINVDFNIYLIANERDIEFKPIVKSIMDELEIPPKNIKYIADTNSQLDTALFAKDFLKESSDSKIIFTNIDTILSSRKKYFTTMVNLLPNESLVDTFEGESHEYSYAKIEGDKVVKIIDKMPISDMACSGLYGFGSKDLFFTEAEELLRNGGRLSFTEFLNKYIKEGRTVYSNHNNSKADTIVLGTPEEYITNLHKIN